MWWGQSGACREAATPDLPPPPYVTARALPPPGTGPERLAEPAARMQHSAKGRHPRCSKSQWRVTCQWLGGRDGLMPLLPAPPTQDNTPRALPAAACCVAAAAPAAECQAGSHHPGNWDHKAEGDAAGGEPREASRHSGAPQGGLNRKPPFCATGQPLSGACVLAIMIYYQRPRAELTESVVLEGCHPAPGQLPCFR